MSKVLHLTDAAERLDVHPATLRRWLLAGRIKGIAKDRNGWWVFEPADIRRVAAWKDQRHVPEVQRKRRR